MNNNIIKDVHICNQERTQELNDRIYDRNLPSSELQMHFAPRSVSTKYATMPIVNPRKKSVVPMVLVSNTETSWRCVKLN